MRPEDIQHRSFLVGLRGYDKEDVRAFLAEVAYEHAEVLAELETLRNRAPSPEPPFRDDIDGVGASVAAILRAAKVSAGEITAEAEARRARVAAEAEELRGRATAEAEELRGRATAEAEELRGRATAEADAIRAQATEEADRLLREATDRSAQLDAEATAQVEARFEEATRREAATRARLREAGDELHRALAALDEVDLREPALGPADAVSLDSPN